MEDPMNRRTRSLFLPALCAAGIALGSFAARAGSDDTETPPPVNAATLPSTPGGASCNPAATAEQNRKRDAALADLGRRLSEEQKPDPDYQVLNRTGANYGSGIVQEAN
jgi:hypothetical protein